MFFTYICVLLCAAAYVYIYIYVFLEKLYIYICITHIMLLRKWLGCPDTGAQHHEGEEKNSAIRPGGLGSGVARCGSWTFAGPRFLGLMAPKSASRLK